MDVSVIRFILADLAEINSPQTKALPLTIAKHIYRLPAINVRLNK